MGNDEFSSGRVMCEGSAPDKAGEVFGGMTNTSADDIHLACQRPQQLGLQLQG